MNLSIYAMWTDFVRDVGGLQHIDPFSRQHCIDFLCGEGLEFYAALSCKEGKSLNAWDVQKSAMPSPNEAILATFAQFFRSFCNVANLRLNSFFEFSGLENGRPFGEGVRKKKSASRWFSEIAIASVDGEVSLVRAE